MQAVAHHPPHEKIEAYTPANRHETQAEPTEKVQGRSTAGMQEVDRQQVQKTIDEPGHAVLGLTVLAYEVTHGLLGNPKTVHMGQGRHVTVHLAI